MPCGGTGKCSGQKGGEIDLISDRACSALSNDRRGRGHRTTHLKRID